jgi:hypothetical protein
MLCWNGPNLNREIYTFSVATFHKINKKANNCFKPCGKLSSALLTSRNFTLGPNEILWAEATDSIEAYTFVQAGGSAL